MIYVLVIVSGFTIWALFSDMNTGNFVQGGSVRELPTILMAFCRAFLSIILHLVIDKDIRQGLDLMKYANNHPWKFDRWWDAYSMGQM